MRYLGNGQYEIQNTKTGEKKVVGSNELTKYGLSVPQTSTPSTQPAQTGSILGNILGSIGRFIAPTTANVVQDINASGQTGNYVNNTNQNTNDLIKTALALRQANQSSQGVAQAFQASKAVSNQIKANEPQFSQDINKSYLDRGAGVGGELGPLLYGLGGGFNGLSGLKSGALTGGILGLSKPGQSADQRLLSGTGGAAGGALVGGTMDILGKLLGAGKNASTEIGKDLRTKVINPKVKVSPNYSQDVANMQASAEGLGLKGSADNQLKQVSNLYQGLNSQLKETVAGNITSFKPTDITSKALESLKGEVDLSNKVVKSQIEKLTSKLSSSTSASTLNDLKFNIQNQMSPIYKKIASGRPLTDVETVKLAFRDAVDEALKTGVPEASDILSKMSQLHQITPGLIKGINKTIGIPLLGVKAPAGVVQSGEDMLGRVLGSVGNVNLPGAKSALTPLLTNILTGQREQSVANPSNTTQQQEPAVQQENNSNNVQSNVDQQNSVAQGGFTSQKLAAAIAMDPKNAATYQAIFKALNPSGDKPLSSTQINQVNLAKSGIRGLSKAEQLLGLRDAQGNQIPDAKVNMGTLVKQLVPGQYLTRDYEAAAFTATEALLRARSGAAVPETEVKRYQQKLFPQFGDSAAVVKQKVTELRSIFNDMLNQRGTGNEDVLQSILNPQ